MSNSISDVDHIPLVLDGVRASLGMRLSTGKRFLLIQGSDMIPNERTSSPFADLFRKLESICGDDEAIFVSGFNDNKLGACIRYDIMTPFSRPSFLEMLDDIGIDVMVEEIPFWGNYNEYTDLIDELGPWITERTRDPCGMMERYQRVDTVPPVVLRESADWVWIGIVFAFGCSMAWFLIDFLRS